VTLKEESPDTLYLDTLYARTLEGLPNSRGIMRTALCAILRTIKGYEYVTLVASGNTPGGTTKDLVRYYERSYGFEIDLTEGTPQEQYDNGLIFMIASIDTIISHCERY